MSGSISSIINGSLLLRFEGVAAGPSDPAKAALGQGVKASLRGGLRLGARAFATAIQGLNTTISVLNLGEDALNQLSKLTDRLASLAGRATQAGVSSESRADLDRQFKKLGKDFQDIVKNSKFGEREYLTHEGLTSLFQAIGLDEATSTSIADIFDKFVIPEVHNADANPVDTYASEEIKGRRPAPIPISAYQYRKTVGTGTFAAESTFSGGADPQGVTSADLNGDGFQDIVSTDGIGNKYRVALGLGDGTFAAPVSYSTTVATPGVVEHGDINDDGREDLAIAHASSIGIVLGNGDGTFTTEVSYAAGTIVSDLAITDFDGDGYRDVVTADSTDATVQVFLGASDGTLSAATSFSAGNAGVNHGPGSVITSDLNGDGKADIVTANSVDNSVSVLLGNGDGTFAAKLDYSIAAGSSTAADVIASDLNNDGYKDLATVDYTSSTVSVLLGNGDGTFDTAVSYAIPVTGTGIAIGDTNSDGNPDLLVASVAGKLLTLQGVGDGTFGAATSIASGGGARLTAADFNGDGITDVATADINITQNVGVYLSNSTTAVTQLSATTTEYNSIFTTERTIRTRPEAYKMLEDLRALKEQIKDNLEAISSAREAIGKNIDLVRAAGFAFLDMSNQIKGNEDPEKVAADLRAAIIKDAGAALSQVENLEPLAVAALTLTTSSLLGTSK